MNRELCVERGEWLGHRVACREVVFELTLEAVEPLRVGAGRSVFLTSPVDMPVYRHRVCIEGVCGELPVIPGSSLRGVLRTASAMVAASCGIEAHTGIAKYHDDCINAICGGAGVFDKLRKVRRDLVPSVVRAFCPTCLLYGAPSYRGKLVVGEFRPVPGTLSLGVKTSVGINRRTGTSAHGVQYTVEYVEPGSRFHGELVAWNTPNWLLSLLAASLLALHEGYVKIGGFKSRGMGRVTIVVDDTLVARIRPVGGKSLPVLDREVDEEIEAPGGCEVTGDALECRGEAAMKLLETLASRWNGFCKKLAKLRHAWLEAARGACSSVGEEG